MRALKPIVVALLAGLILGLPLWLMPAAADGKAARELPPKFEKPPYSLMSLSVGAPNKGWQVRPIEVKRRKYLRVKESSQSRDHGHPALVKMLQRNARDIARSVPGSVMLVGDLSTERGGPLSGHHSHQSGRDADVAFYAKNAKGKSVRLDNLVAFGGDGKAKNGSGLIFDDYRNWLLVKSWLDDHRAGISFIFISRPLRKRLLDYAADHSSFKRYVKAAAVLMREPARAEAHDDHFHVRISCPKRQSEICREHPL